MSCDVGGDDGGDDDASVCDAFSLTFSSCASFPNCANDLLRPIDRSSTRTDEIHLGLRTPVSVSVQIESDIRARRETK
jgi:hypothetical protein